MFIKNNFSSTSKVKIWIYDLENMKTFFLTSYFFHFLIAAKCHKLWSQTFEAVFLAQKTNYFSYWSRSKNKVRNPENIWLLCTFMFFTLHTRVRVMSWDFCIKLTFQACIWLILGYFKLKVSAKFQNIRVLRPSVNIRSIHPNLPAFFTHLRSTKV